jgi:sortase A
LEEVGRIRGLVSKLPDDDLNRQIKPNVRPQAPERVGKVKKGTVRGTVSGSGIGRGIWRGIETILLATGITMLGLYGISRLDTNVASRIAVLRFKNSAAASPSGATHLPKQIRLTDEKVDFSLWDERRVLDYREALSMNFDPALAVLSIPKLQLEVPVFDGTNELILNRGAGRIKGTARPGAPGNMGIAAHRDGFFRGLKDIWLGDRIELLTVRQKFTYIVDDIVIVSPDDVQVLQPRARPSLTLVTCYPFYFIGDAPRRYIVQASEAPAYPIRNHSDPKKGETQ